MKPLKKSVSITIDEPILTQVRERAKQDGRSVSSYVNMALRTYLARLAPDHRGIDFTGDGSRPIKVSISLTLDEPILTKIQELAELEDRSVSSYITLILRTHLEHLEQ